ncbi:MAG TPA: hypothetical protein VMS65_13575 [Polyangiaceae bacterium]|nr:hypothetical protein [Polyangiaceae bacterium]
MTKITPVLAVIALGCTPAKPPRWEEGGTPLVTPAARWDRPDEDSIEIRANGQVLEDGDLIYVIDRVGRIVDEDYEAVAVLQPDGHLIGTDSTSLGQVGITNGAPPGRFSAWLSVRPDGTVVYFDDDGTQVSRGKWYGCTGPALRTCTLVTQIITLRDFARRQEGSVSVGIGVGVGF